MKKTIVIFILTLATSSFSVECTQEQYKPFFDDNNTRYMPFALSYTGVNVIDLNSIKYDKSNHRIQAWMISQLLDHKEVGIVKGLREYDIKNNSVRLLQSVMQTCSGRTVDRWEGVDKWSQIIPQSVNETMLSSLKEYLNIK